jgi:hexosaminidase
MNRILLAGLFIFCIRPLIFSQADMDRYPIIPQPVSLQASNGYFVLDTAIRTETPGNQLKEVVELLSNAISKSTGITLSEIPKDSKNTIRFELDNRITNPEEYQMTVSPNEITIRVLAAAGAFYAIQTIRQLLYSEIGSTGKPEWKIPCCRITDYPRYAYRGFHLDVSRHFFTKEYLMKIIDFLGMYKINRLQLHLTDDQGWRVQIDQFPLLTEVGAWRTFNRLDSICIEKSKTNPDFIIDKRFIRIMDGKTVYGGFYTKRDIREIVAYAADRFIEVVPEIDMPGHMSAAISAYPYLSCTGSTGWGKEFSVPACPCNPEMMDFAFRVWDEITDLFPSKFVHIGADEVEKDTWASSPECQKFVNNNRPDSLVGIQNYFVTELQKHLEAKGKTVIAWDDVIDGEVNDKLVMMYWRDWLTDSPSKCAHNGNNLILTPWTVFYFSGQHTDESVKRLYDYDVATEQQPEVAVKVMGFQACVWTEEIPSEARFEYHVFPQLQAFSETCWSSAKDWESFRIRLNSHLKRMDSMRINYRKTEFKN